MQVLTDHKTRTLVYGGGAGGGKSWLGCSWLMNMCLAYPHTRWFMAREVLKDLKRSTVKTFMKVAKLYGLEKQFRYNSHNGEINFNNGSQILLIELAYKPSDPLYQDLGSTEYTGGFIEEGGEIHFDAYEALKNSRIGRQYNDKYNIFPTILVTCNPTKNWLYHLFYKPFMNGTIDEDCMFIPSLIGDNCFIDSQAKAGLMGFKNEAQKQRLLYGNWDYEDEPEQIIKYEWLEKCFLARDYINTQKFMGVDVARYGNDKSVIAKIEGNTLYSVEQWEKIDTVTFADIVKTEIIAEKIMSENVGVDVVGVGAGTVDALKKKGYNVFEIVSGAVAEDCDETGGHQFNNLRSQMWWALRERIKRGDFCIDMPINSELAQQIIKDLTATKYEIVRDKQIKAESKSNIRNRLGRSPDTGDAVVYAHWMKCDGEIKQTEDIYYYKNDNSLRGKLF
jgi:hypothetical protein